MMQCGRGTFGLPSMGSWLTYGLGSESQNLPGYVVLTSGRGSSGGATLWQSGFLPSPYAGVPFRNQGEPVLNLANPPGVPPELREGSGEIEAAEAGELPQLIELENLRGTFHNHTTASDGKNRTPVILSGGDGIRLASHIAGPV